MCEEQFLQRLESRYAGIEEHCEYCSYTDARNTIRDAAIEGFPYIVIFEEVGDFVVVAAVHCTPGLPGIFG